MKGWFTENVTLKLIALLLSLVLHLFVRGDRDGTLLVHVPVITKIPLNQVLMTERITHLEVSFQGKRSTLDKIAQQGIPSVMLDLKTLGPGIVEFTPDMIHIPSDAGSGVSITNIHPKTKLVDLDRIETKTLPIDPRLIGEPPKGWTITSKILDPAEVEVTGPESTLRTLSFVLTEPIDLNGRRSSFETHVALRSFASRHVTLTPQSATLKIEIEPTLVERTIPGVPIRPSTPLAGPFTLTPQTVSVQLKGPAHVLEAIQREDLEASIDLLPNDPPPPSTTRKAVSVHDIPAETQVLRIRPPIVELQRSLSKPTPPP